MKPLFLFSRHPHLDQQWPFLTERLLARLGELGEVKVVEAARDEPLHRLADLADVWGIGWFGGLLTADCIAAAPRLRAIGGNTDNSGRGLPWEAMSARGISFHDSTRAWDKLHFGQKGD